MNCKELFEVLHDYASGDLVIESRTTVEVHVRGCSGCGILVHSYVHTVRVARALPTCKLPAAFEAKMRAGYRARFGVDPAISVCVPSAGAGRQT